MRFYLYLYIYMLMLKFDLNFISCAIAISGIWSSWAKGIPVAILRPVIGLTEATATTLRGVRNEIDNGEKRQEYLSKYKTPGVKF